MYFLLKMGIFQPATLVYRSVYWYRLKGSCYCWWFDGWEIRRSPDGVGSLFHDLQWFCTSQVVQDFWTINGIIWLLPTHCNSESWRKNCDDYFPTFTGFRHARSHSHDKPRVVKYTIQTQQPMAILFSCSSEQPPYKYLTLFDTWEITPEHLHIIA